VVCILHPFILDVEFKKSKVMCCMPEKDIKKEEIGNLSIGTRIY
jgi:hypothetical protein